MALIWVPPDINDLITVFVDGQADSSTVDGMHIINGAASEWLSGELDDYTYFELLDHFGIDPLGFVGEAEERMALAMR